MRGEMKQPTHQDLMASAEQWAQSRRDEPSTCWKCTTEIARGHQLCANCVTVLDERDRRDRAGRAMNSMPSRFRWARFDAPELRERVKVDDFERLIEKLRAVVADKGPVGFLGLPGSGKSSLMVAVLVEWAVMQVRPWIATERELDRLTGEYAMYTERARKGRDPQFADAFTLATARSRHALGADEAPELEGASYAGILGIDELGAETSRDTSLVEVIHARHNGDRRIAWTSGFTKEELIAKYGGGVWRRLSEGGTIIRLGGK